MKQSVTSRYGISTLALVFVLFASSVPTADAVCEYGCAFIERNLGVARTSNNRIDIGRTVSPDFGRQHQRRTYRRNGVDYPTVAFYVLNLGPHAIRRLAISPETDTFWGCADFGYDCNRLIEENLMRPEDSGRIESGERVFFEIFYEYRESDLTIEDHDLEINDSNGERSQEYEVRIPRTGPIPTLIVRTSSRDRMQCREGMQRSTLREIFDFLTLGLTREEVCEKAWDAVIAGMHVPSS